MNYEWNVLGVSDVHLQKAIALGQRSQNDEFLICCRVLGSRLRVAQGGEKRIWTAFKRALIAAHPQGYVRTFNQGEASGKMLDCNAGITVFEEATTAKRITIAMACWSACTWPMLSSVAVDSCA